MSDPIARSGTWKPKSAVVGVDADDTDGIAGLASKFDKLKPAAPVKAKAAPAASPATTRKVRTTDLAHNNVFIAQKSVIEAEEDFAARMAADGKSTEEMVHPSQKVVDEGAEDHIPEWRAKEIKEMQAEKNDTFDLPEREAARVRKRNLEKKRAERAIKAKIAAGLVELDGITGLAEADETQVEP